MKKDPREEHSPLPRPDVANAADKDDPAVPVLGGRSGPGQSPDTPATGSPDAVRDPTPGTRP
ncbi:hypothetical protein [Longispora urticae]